MWSVVRVHIIAVAGQCVCAKKCAVSTHSADSQSGRQVDALLHVRCSTRPHAQLAVERCYLFWCVSGGGMVCYGVCVRERNRVCVYVCARARVCWVLRLKNNKITTDDTKPEPEKTALLYAPRLRGIKKGSGPE